MSDKSQRSYERAQAERDRQEEPEPDDEEARLQRQLDAADHERDVEGDDL